MNAYAADAPTNVTARVPASVNPANVTWSLEEQPPVTTRPKKPLQVTDQESTGTKNYDLFTAEPSFTLKKVELIGDKFPMPPEVKAIYESALNKPISFQGLMALADAMQTKYRELGYILVQVVVPPQEIDEKTGVIKLQIIEGQIQDVIFKGDDPRAAKKQLQRYAAAIEKEDPVTYQTIDHFLTLANNLPGINVKANLVPNPKVVGGADLVVDVEEIGQSGYLSFNNYGTQYIGPGQAFAGGSIYDIFGADSISVNGSTSTSNANQLNYISGSYDVVFGRYSTEFNPSFSSTVTRPGNVLSLFDMYGYSTKYTFNLNQPLIVTSTQELKLITSYYQLSSVNTVFDQQAQLYKDQISAFTGGLSYQGIVFNSMNSMDVYGTVGTPVFGVPDELQNPSRLNGRNQFVALNFDTSTTKYLTQNTSFNLATTGQLTPDPLLISEQIGYGGMNFGQGFTPYVISGDNGFFGDFSLRYNLPTFGGINLLQPEVFYSAGVVGNNQALTGTLEGASGSSAGVGLNVVLLGTCQVNMVLAKPIKLTQVSGIDRGWQGLVNVVALF